MKYVRGWMAGTAVLAVGLYLLTASGPGRAADDKLADKVSKLADAMAKNDPEAKKQAAALGKDVDLDVIMDLFKPRSKGGIGVGEKGSVKQDGIEIKLQALDKTAPTAKDATAEGDAIAKAAYVTAVIAAAVADKVPADKKKDAKKWKDMSEEMSKTANELAVAAKSKNPMNIQKAAKSLNNSCIKCHDVFR